MPGAAIPKDLSIYKPPVVKKVVKKVVQPVKPAVKSTVAENATVKAPAPQAPKSAISKTTKPKKAHSSPRLDKPIASNGKKITKLVIMQYKVQEIINEY